MRALRTALAVLAALAVIPAAAIALSGGTALAAQPSAPRPAPAPRTVVMTCLSQGQVRPASYMIACGDGSQYLAKLRWSSWTSGLASGTGRYYLNTCTPNCAQGKYLDSQVIVVLWRPAAVPHRRGQRGFTSQRAFTMMTIIYSGKRPAHTAQSFTQSLWYPII